MAPPPRGKFSGWWFAADSALAQTGTPRADEECCEPELNREGGHLTSPLQVAHGCAQHPPLPYNPGLGFNLQSHTSTKLSTNRHRDKRECGQKALKLRLDHLTTKQHTHLQFASFIFSLKSWQNTRCFVNVCARRTALLLQLLLGADVGGAATLALAAVGRSRVQTRVAPVKQYKPCQSFGATRRKNISHRTPNMVILPKIELIFFHTGCTTVPCCENVGNFIPFVMEGWNDPLNLGVTFSRSWWVSGRRAGIGAACESPPPPTLWHCREASTLISALVSSFWSSNRPAYFDTYFLQIILSQLYFCANILREGSMIPPRRRSTKCRVDSAQKEQRTSLHENTLVRWQHTTCRFLLIKSPVLVVWEGIRVWTKPLGIWPLPTKIQQCAISPSKTATDWLGVCGKLYSFVESNSPNNPKRKTFMQARMLSSDWLFWSRLCSAFDSQNYLLLDLSPTFLDVIVRQGPAILQLLASEDQPLLIWRNTCNTKTDHVLSLLQLLGHCTTEVANRNNGTAIVKQQLTNFNFNCQKRRKNRSIVHGAF